MNPRMGVECVPPGCGELWPAAVARSGPGVACAGANLIHRGLRMPPAGFADTWDSASWGPGCFH